MKRRQAITAAVGLSVGLAGCSGSRSGDSGVDLTVFNQAAVPYTVEIEFLGEGSSESAARAYSTTLEVEPNGEQTRAAVAESGRYLVRYRVYEGDSALTDEDHVHYIPSGDGSESLTFDVQETGALTRR